MEFSESVLEIARKAAGEYPDDISSAVDAAEKAIRKLKEFESIVKDLIRQAVTEMVYDARHKANVRIRQSTGQYGGPAKVVVGDSRSVNRAIESVYHYSIAGTMLGMVVGGDLEAIADSEKAVGDGHLFNSRLARLLIGRVKEEHRVMDDISEKQLRAVFRKAQRSGREPQKPSGNGKTKLNAEMKSSARLATH